MKTNRVNLEIGYVRGTEYRNPSIFIGFNVPFLQRLKVLFLLLVGKTVSYSLTENDIEGLSRKIVRWRFVSKLRAARLGRKSEQGSPRS